MKAGLIKIKIGALLKGCLILTALFVYEAYAQQTGSRFVRITKDLNGNPKALETSIITYGPASNSRLAAHVRVALVSAVHVGEKSYYDELNRAFRLYDAVLYELVALHGTDISRRVEHSTSALSFLQQAVKGALRLEFQLERINYAAPNFVHADMSAEQFSLSMQARNEDFLQLFMRAAIAHTMQERAGGSMSPPNLALLLALVGEKRHIALRRIMASELENMEAFVEILNGKEGSTLVSERNKVALQVLNRELKRAKSNLAIFYGGAHMPDMEERLISEYGLREISRKWLVAWNLSLR